VTSPAAGAVRTPSGERRRRLGTASARSSLLTVLGEFVHPAGEPVWTASLVAAMAALGVEEKAARQALSRTAGEGLVDSTRHGRRVLWHLTDDGTRLLDEGTRRIYGFMRGRPAWDGRWLVVDVAIPESQRRLRHQLRTRLTWLGLGTPTPGLWVSPDARKAPSVAAVIDDLGLGGLAFAWTGPMAGIGTEGRLLAQAWDLDDVEARYQQFLGDFKPRQAGDDAEAFVAQVQLVEAWRRFPFVDPDLPAELLDHDWPGTRAARTFHDCHRRWQKPSARAWQTFIAEGGPRP
jgi:phenylacetic acid degradation operon negative regulatory protein